MGPSRRLILWLMLFPLVVSTACLTPAAGTPAATAPAATAAGTTPGAPPGATPTTGAASASPTPAEAGGTPTISPTQAGTDVPLKVIFGSGPFVLTDTLVALTSLSGYTATLTLSFEGTHGGQPQKWSKTGIMLARQQPAARQYTLKFAGDVSPGLFLAEADGAAYERRGEQPCTATALMPQAGLSERFEPAGSLSPIVGADEAGTETINGVLAKHYTFDERALARSGFTKSMGEVWVAAEGAYIVKYTLTTKAGAEFFGPDTEGTLTWDYELTGANQPVTIEVPQDCPAGLIDVPLLPDAANVRSLPGVLTYDSTTRPAEAGAFYRDKLPTLGWTLANTSLITDTAALLDFSQGHANLTVIVSPKQDLSAIRIVQTR
jgi:hypothetical protein